MSKGATKTIWQTKDGRRIRVKDMTDSHLVNTVNFCIKTGEFHRNKALVDAYGFESMCRGEMAQDAIAQEIRMLEESDIWDLLSIEVPTWDALVTEVYKRDLEDKISGGKDESRS